MAKSVRKATHAEIIASVVEGNAVPSNDISDAVFIQSHDDVDRIILDLVDAHGMTPDQMVERLTAISNWIMVVADNPDDYPYFLEAARVAVTAK